MRRLVAVLSLLIAAIVPVSSQQTEQTPETPPWLLFERAEERFRQRDYGKALQLYGEALAEKPVYPEAILGIARVYRAEADTVLAERYYRQAIEQRQQLVIPEQVYAIQMELADLLRLSGDLEGYRQELKVIVDEDPVFSDPENDWQREAMLNALYEGGLDRVLRLYRLDFPAATEAHRRLGHFYLQRNEQPAIEHFMFAIVGIASRAVNAVLDRRFDFQFNSLTQLFDVVQEYPGIAEYLAESQFREILRHLATALRRLGPDDAQQQAIELEQVLTKLHN